MIVEKARAASSQARVPKPDMQLKAEVAKTEPSRDAGVASCGIVYAVFAHGPCQGYTSEDAQAMIRARPKA